MTTDPNNHSCVLHWRMQVPVVYFWADKFVYNPIQIGLSTIPTMHISTRILSHTQSKCYLLSFTENYRNSEIMHYGMIFHMLTWYCSDISLRACWFTEALVRVCNDIDRSGSGTPDDYAFIRAILQDVVVDAMFQVSMHFAASYRKHFDFFLYVANSLNLNFACH